MEAQCDTRVLTIAAPEQLLSVACFTIVSSVEFGEARRTCVAVRPDAPQSTTSAFVQESGLDAARSIASEFSTSVSPCAIQTAAGSVITPTTIGSTSFFFCFTSERDLRASLTPASIVSTTPACSSGEAPTFTDTTARSLEGCDDDASQAKSAKCPKNAAAADNLLLSPPSTKLLLFTSSCTIEEGSFDMVGFLSLARALRAASPKI
mmetsp:Transcript_36926/g.75275  ORF Transcript_36926/g.75275 Transcript_36926/m.75275 type:complete len:207 (+) Transcript_36926:851-1471(+)